jgi:dTDP-4-dehydrorhamnose reductase
LSKAQAREELRVVDDQYGSPTWTGDLAEALVIMGRKILLEEPRVEWGTYHFCGGGHTTWHGFAQAIVDEALRLGRLEAFRVTPISSAQYPGPARRSPWSVLDCRKAAAVFNLTPRPWRQGLREMLGELFLIHG